MRFDGGHKRDDFLTGTFSNYVEFVPVCPELEAGLGTPREPMRLVRDGDAGAVRLITVKTAVDLTSRLAVFSRRRARQLEAEDLCGYVLKKDSPSCGMERVKVYDHNMVPSKTGQGLFAEALVARFPFLPVEEEGRLVDPQIRDNFVERVFVYRRLRDLFESRWTPGALVAFHTAHKLTLMAHSIAAYQQLGRLVASAKETPRDQLRARYMEGFMTALAAIATPKRHTNVLQHMAGYFKKLLDAPSRAELASAVEDYRLGFVPLIVPITLLRHHVRHHGLTYLAGQAYLDPHPKELMLRNHV